MRTALTICGVLASAVLAAPHAVADDNWTPVTSLSAAPGLSWGPTGSYGTNCTHVLTATTVYAQENMVFLDMDEGLIASVPIVAGKAVATWIPRTPGPHRIIAYQTSHGGPEITVQVGTGVALGPVCFVLP